MGLSDSTIGLTPPLWIGCSFPVECVNTTYIVDSWNQCRGKRRGLIIGSYVHISQGRSKTLIDQTSVIVWLYMVFMTRTETIAFLMTIGRWVLLRPSENGLIIQSHTEGKTIVIPKNTLSGFHRNEFTKSIYLNHSNKLF